MKLYTATIKYNGPSKVDITAKSAPEEYKIFAPTWDLVMKFKNRIVTWQEYIELYCAEMDASWNANRQAWIDFLSGENAVLCCYCTNRQCHRYLLVEILIARGIESGLEVTYVKELDF